MRPWHGGRSRGWQQSIATYFIFEFIPVVRHEGYVLRGLFVCHYPIIGKGGNQRSRRMLERIVANFIANMPLPFWTIGTLYGASSVMLGAFGAHGLKQRIADPARITNWGTAAQYQLVHSAVLTFASVVAPQNTVAMGLFTAGMTMFSGSIYLLVLDPQRFKFLGPVTPLGGLCLIGGWVALAVAKRPVVPKFK
ncbi:hypothetical protein BKA66DRAFT_440321 [Pyrenochaeta sp. MPI-SDFR-AT-0127]|nr:hypothetical protein BKA66DRAFT_440321 [Pyrenochaeta sp. MPI-SDFR-AT-0127]